MSSSSVQFEFALNNSARSRPTVPVAGPAAVETVERVVWKRRGAMVHAEGTGAVEKRLTSWWFRMVVLPNRS